MFIEIYFLRETIEVSKMKKEYKDRLITIYMSNSRLIIKTIIGGILIRILKIINRFKIMKLIQIPFSQTNIKIRVFWEIN